MPAPLTDPDMDAWCRIAAWTTLFESLDGSHELHPFTEAVEKARGRVRGATIRSALMNAWLEEDRAVGDVLAECAAGHLEEMIATLQAAGRCIDRRQRELEDARPAE